MFILLPLELPVESVWCLLDLEERWQGSVRGGASEFSLMGEGVKFGGIPILSSSVGHLD